MQTVKANKTNLNKIIKWSSSSFNEYKKSTVIKKILTALSDGTDTEMHFGTGAFSERNCWGWGYDFVIKDGNATLTHTVTRETYLLIKTQEVSAKNKQCKICGIKPSFYSDGLHNLFDSCIDLVNGGWTAVRAGKDKENKVIIYGQGDGETDLYYPKYCPECGRKLTN